jgi:hypothetical protein
MGPGPGRTLFHACCSLSHFTTRKSFFTSVLSASCFFIICSYTPKASVDNVFGDFWKFWILPNFSHPGFFALKFSKSIFSTWQQYFGMRFAPWYRQMYVVWEKMGAPPWLWPLLLAGGPWMGVGAHNVCRI